MTPRERWIIQRRDEDLAQAELAGANEAVRRGIAKAWDSIFALEQANPGTLTLNMPAEAAMTDTDVPDPDVTVRDTEVDPNERTQAVFDMEKAECDRFIAEFGGLYNDKGTRHRVILYYEDMRRIAEMCRFFRDTAITEGIQVSDDQTS